VFAMFGYFECSKFDVDQTVVLGPRMSIGDRLRLVQ
jgi:hypothetical protein